MSLDDLDFNTSSDVFIDGLQEGLTNLDDRAAEAIGASLGGLASGSPILGLRLGVSPDF
ncbi:hypothetical protein ACFQL7_27085 [Halocatena marina]|uniref:Uncharacterized protein n=1 Tax=Halocatena marina TaxID=2934937 RepID=A0ABD5YVH9_9EURY